MADDSNVYNDNNDDNKLVKKKIDKKKNIKISITVACASIFYTIVSLYFVKKLGNHWATSISISFLGLLLIGSIAGAFKIHITEDKRMQSSLVVIYIFFFFVIALVYAITPELSQQPIKKSIFATHSTPISSNIETAPAYGKKLTIDLQPGQVYTVDNVRNGQKWRYASYNGSFQHRVDKGDNTACWKEVNNNLSWNADYHGKLQVRGGNTPVTLTIEIM